MKPGFLLGLVAAAAVTVPATTAAAQQRRPAQAQRDWTRSVVQTPEGGFLMGNPAARVKVVEYLSLTCPHCAEFAEQGAAGLRNYVRSGRVSVEYRNLVLNGVDVAASLLARCGGPTRFFTIAERMLATQPQWMGRINALTEAQRQQITSLEPGQRLTRLAEAGGLTSIATQNGVTAQQVRQCLASEDGRNRLGQMGQAAAALGVTGTPTFLINGNIVQAHDWAALEPLIRQAGG